MRRNSLIATLILLCTSVSAQSPAPRSFEALVSNPGFEQLKALAGRWHGIRYDGKSVRASYEVVSNRTAVIARFQTEGDAEMVTVFSANGDRLFATHYCAAGNQPQLQTAGVRPAQKTFLFSHVRATSLPDPAGGHMVGLVLTIENNDSFSEEWNWVEAGTSLKGLFRYVRAK